MIVTAVVGAAGLLLGVCLGLIIQAKVDKPKIQYAEDTTKDLVTKRLLLENTCSALSSQQDSLQEIIENLKNESDRLVRDNALKEAKLNKHYEETEAIAIKKHDETVASLDLEIQAVKDKLASYQSQEAAAVEANKRKFEEAHKQDFYRLILSDKDVEDVKNIRKCIPYFKDGGEALNKVIYKVYYERPYNDLIGRLFGSRTPSGIYKITNIENGMCYVGQSVNIAERFKQHIKCAVGADGSAARNKLYEAMSTFGVENFTFEVIEECPREQLDDKEKYWQTYFKAKEFGYSLR